MSPGERHSSSWRRIGMYILSVPLLLVVTLWLLGCSLLPGSTAEPEPVITETATPMVAPALSVTPPNPAATPVNPSAPLTLTLWLPPDMALGEGASGQAMANLNRDFSAENPRIRIVAVPKARYGLAGVVNMLLATQPVAPGRMPDIIAFDTADLHKLADRQVISPLDGLLPGGTWEDLYPFALEAVTVEDEVVAVPFQADIAFLAYNSAMVNSPPRTWQELSQSGTGYIFPAAAGDGSAADAFLLQYLAEGGTLLEDGYPSLDSSIAADVLRAYRDEIESGAVPSMVRSLGTLEDCWAIYLAGHVGMANASSWQFQQDRDGSQRTRYARIPTASGEAITLAHTWAWAIVTRDPERQDAAATYLAFAMEPERLSSWSRASHHLPVQNSVLALAIQDEAYRAFLSEQLQHARPYPNLRDYSKIQDAIVRAVEDVLDGASTPERAAVDAAARVHRLR